MLLIFTPIPLDLVLHSVCTGRPTTLRFQKASRKKHLSQTLHLKTMCAVVLPLNYLLALLRTSSMNTCMYSSLIITVCSNTSLEYY